MTIFVCRGYLSVGRQPNGGRFTCVSQTISFRNGPLRLSLSGVPLHFGYDFSSCAESLFRCPLASVLPAKQFVG